MMTTTRSAFGRALLAASAAAAASLSLPPIAHAEPPRSHVVAIYDADRCDAEVCTDGDPLIRPGDAVSGPIQVHVHSEAALGLEWVRLEAHVEGTPQALQICLQQWRPPAGTFSFDGYYTWDSRKWPDPNGPESDCEHLTNHYHDEATKNARYTLRAVARERPPERDIETDAPGFDVRIRNAPTAPSWVGGPSVSGGDQPRVTLTWQANPEERTQPSADIVEYHFVRVGPDGSEEEFAVSATDPQRQGCQRLSTLYRCVDRGFAHSGDYDYALLAFRNGSGSGMRCTTTDGRCLESPLSRVHTVTVTVPVRRVTVVAPQGSGSPTASASASPGPADPSAAPLAVDPPSDRSEQLAAAADGDGGSPAVPVAAGLVTLLAAAHLARALRRDT